MGFNRAFTRVIEHEKGYVEHPDDPGGETNWGITVAVARANNYTGPMKNLPLSLARAIYKKDYWDRAKADQYHPAIGFQLFDAAVNHGVVAAIKMLQRAVGVKDDGIVGPVTLSAILAHEPHEVSMRFLSERLYFYTDIRHWSTFGKGWARRVAANLVFAAEDLK